MTADQLQHNHTPSIQPTAPGELRALILDFDGVLVESEGLKTEVFREIFARFPEHLDTMMAYHAANITMPRHKKFERLAELTGRVGDAAFSQLLASEFSRLAVERTVACREVNGATAFLEEFASRLPLYLASITPEADLLTIVERRGWRAYFSAVYGYPPRPKAAAVEQAAGLVGGLTQVALIGDSPGDWLVARETGIEFIGRDSGLAFPNPHPPLYPDLIAIANLIRARVK